MLEEIPCVLLAGGNSSRMGRDKCFLPFENTDLIHYQVSRLQKIFKKVFVSCKEDKFNGDFNLILDENLPFFSSDHSPQNPLLALYSILKFFKDSFVFVLAVDMPCVSKEDIEKMYIKLDPKSQILLAKDEKHLHYLCGFYSSKLKAKAFELLKQNYKSIKMIANEADFVSFNSSHFINLNYPKDYVSLNTH